MTAYDNHLNGAIAARATAKLCLEYARQDPQRAWKHMADHDEAIERAEWYESRLHWYAAEEKRNAA